MLTTEQGGSLKEFLEIAGICRGDTADVECAVGVLSERKGPRICFCSVYLRRIGDICQKGWWWQRRRRLPNIIVVRNNDEITEALNGFEGMVYMRARVRCADVIELTIDPTSLQLFPVETLPIDAMCPRPEPGPEDIMVLFYQNEGERVLRSRDGKPIAREIVCNVVDAAPQVEWQEEPMYL